MTTMLEKAKDLIEKGEQLNDPEIVQMGYDLLQDASPDLIEYKCQNCEHELKSPKKRKKCPQCGKHKLIEKVNESQQETKNTFQQFNKQIRDPKNKKYIYDDNGNVVGKRASKKEYEGFENLWKDDHTEGNDEINEKLKKVTKVSSRSRKPPKKIDAQCIYCNKIEKVHPIHGSSREAYVCSDCIKQRSK